MAQNHKEENNYPKALAISTGLMGAFIALSFIWIIGKFEPNEELGMGGMVVNYGTSIEGMGTDYTSIEEPSMAPDANGKKPDQITPDPTTKSTQSQLSDKNLTNLTFCPKNTDLSFKHEFMQKMTKKAERKSKATILIYGANDTWTACALNLHPKAKALKFVKANSGHRTRIKDLSQDEKNQIYASLKNWMKTDVTRL